MKKPITRFISDESGTAAIEYVLIVAAISIAIVNVVAAVGEDVVAMFQTIGDGVSEVVRN